MLQGVFLVTGFVIGLVLVHNGAALPYLSNDPGGVIIGGFIGAFVGAVCIVFVEYFIPESPPSGFM